MKITNILTTYPEDRMSQPVEMQVESHWNDSGLVHLRFGVDGKSPVVTVNAEDLKRAVDNATNHKK